MSCMNNTTSWPLRVIQGAADSHFANASCQRRGGQAHTHVSILPLLLRCPSFFGMLSPALMFCISPCVCCCSDLGCHIDGFIATQAQTVLVAASFDTPVTGKAADLLEAARTAFNAAIRLVKPGAVCWRAFVRLHVHYAIYTYLASVVKY